MTGNLWTAREIAQQPDVWRTLATSLDADKPRIDAFLAPLLAKEDLRIVLTGAGTSAFAGQILAPGLSRTLRRRIDAVATTDLVSNPREYLAEDVPTLLVSFARSGDSPESLAAVELAEEVLSECHHLVLTCNPDGQLYRNTAGEHSLALLMPEGTNDRGFAMTSSVTSMMLAALTVLGANPDVTLLADVAADALPDLAKRARVLAEDGADRFVYLGSGPLTGLARESALKLLELTAGRVVSYFDSSLGFRHGPKSVLNPATVALVYLSNDPYTRRYDLDIARELRADLPEGQVITIGCRDDAEEETWSFPGLGHLPDATVAPVLLLAAQHVALATSRALGLDPDNPFPGHEVNRVVKGVTIHALDE
ncbi:tagatose-6-phosphate ketose/aldose isomerase [Amycolatopsis sacchari]|uniref:Tagatose-6-phosphate ketose/aldose isomerase n=1 Tax=Amycolatopsis sacchari TaxID=115433 RepID=A0A1I3T1T9_9PSEU|nr:SIS domain-containing protein [Amycolatopsis sacchari]SFJ63507.1 tagatose-6-phosphate ketose/aldose isomerase [Amycolatopsis sacchari]